MNRHGMCHTLVVALILFLAIVGLACIVELVADVVTNYWKG